MQCFWLSIFLLLGAGSLSAQTNWLWARSGGGKGNDQTFSIAADNAGNIYTAGYYSDSAIFSGTTVRAAKGTKFFLAKYSPSGSLIWFKTSIAKGQSEATSVCLSQNKYLYITGYFSDSLLFVSDTLYSPGTAQNFFLAKFDLSGNEIWAKAATASGGDFRKAAASDTAGNAYICGSFSGAATFGSTHYSSINGSEDIFIIKYSPDGALLWGQHIGAASDDAAFGIASAESGNFVITGSFGDTVDFGGITLIASGTSDIFIAKYSANGNLIWARQAGDTASGTGSAVAIDREENVYVTGAFAGVTPSDCDGTGNIYIAKYNRDGIRQWSKCPGSSGEETGNSVATDKSGNIFVTGAYDEPLDFGTGELAFDTLFDLFVVKMNSSGTAVWADRASGGGDDVGNSVAIDSTGNIFVAGEFTDTVNFGNISLESGGLTDMFITKIGAQSSVNNFFSIGSSEFAIYPNPAQTELNLSCPTGSSGEIEVELFSVLGVSVKKIPPQKITGKQIVRIPLDGLAKGIYLCRISEAEIMHHHLVEIAR